MRKKPVIVLIFVLLGFFSLLFLLKIFFVQAQSLNCSLTSGSCIGSEVTVLRMSATNNAHAELASQENYNYSICCSGIEGLGNSCSGSYAVVLKLSSATNAHTEKNTQSNYSQNACLSADNPVNCDYATDCSSLGRSYVCLATISGATNAHTANCETGYLTKVCCDVAVPPVVSNVQLNEQNDITLTESTTTAINATATVYDHQGCSTISSVIAKIYRSGVTNGKDCTTDDNNCYSVASCSQDEGSCTGPDDPEATYTCSIEMQFHADPTDSGTPWASQYWRVWIEATDDSGLTGEGYSPSNAPEVLSLIALDVTNSIIYGSLNPGEKNDPLDKITTITATGNVSLDVNLYGTTMTSGENSIVVGQQKYALSENTAYDEGTSLLVSPGEEAELDCPKTTIAGSPQTKNIWWGIEIPVPQVPGDYSGTNTFEAVKNEIPWP